jgi:hypothetical protein
MSGYKDFHVRIPNDVHTKLQLVSAERSIAQKWLIVSALEEYLSGGKEADTEALNRELQELKRRIAALRGDVEILGELVSFFIFHWLGYTPRLEKAERTSLAVEAKERHQRFMDMFVKKLKLGDLGLANVYAEMGRSLEKKDEGDEEDEAI